MECVMGGLAACGACLLTNPLDVVKTRLQLQGELKHRGAHPVHYRDPLRAFFVVARNDGLRGLQKGLVPALWCALESLPGQAFLHTFRPILMASKQK